jgi:hypothetical protein
MSYRLSLPQNINNSLGNGGRPRLFENCKEFHTYMSDTLLAKAALQNIYWSLYKSHEAMEETR